MICSTATYLPLQINLNQIIFIGLRSSKDYYKSQGVVWVYGNGHKGVNFCVGRCVLREWVVEGGGLDGYFGEQELITVFAFPTNLRPVLCFPTGEVAYRYKIHTSGGCLNIQPILACGGEVLQREEKYNEDSQPG